LVGQLVRPSGKPTNRRLMSSGSHRCHTYPLRATGVPMRGGDMMEFNHVIRRVDVLAATSVWYRTREFFPIGES
jgi:hypothetical protein